MQIIIIYKFMNISIIMHCAFRTLHSALNRHYELIFVQWFAAFERVAENLAAGVVGSVKART